MIVLLEGREKKDGPTKLPSSNMFRVISFTDLEHTEVLAYLRDICILTEIAKQQEELHVHHAVCRISRITHTTAPSCLPSCITMPCK
jgi:hypothetical protein